VSSGSEDNKFKQIKRDLDKAKQRRGELDAIIKKLLEQTALGIISDERFAAMTTDYEKEQKELTAKISELEGRLDKRDADGGNAMKFLNAVRKYSDITELDATILNDLIDSIVIYAPEQKWAKASRVQRVDINYKFIGMVRMGEDSQSA
jgi:Skp family chaperone for outer membrane proteins